MKRWVVAVLAVVLVLGLAACGGNQSQGRNNANDHTGASNSPASSEDNQSTVGQNEEKVLGFSISTLNNPFFVDLRDGAQKAADKLEYKLVVLDAQDDSAKQVGDVEDLIQQKVDLLIINPTDSAAIVTAIEAANQANIPVITVDRGADGGEVITHIASDNVAGGKMAAEYIKEKLNGKGKLVELEGIPGTSAARDRGAGFNEVIKADPELTVVAKQPADFDRAKGMSVMENILQAQSEIDAVFAHNDEMALGALEAIEAAGRKGIIVVGFDATPDAVQAVEEGRLAATVAQQPVLMGEMAVEYAATILKGEKVESYIPVELKLVTQ
ncbi:MAG: Ribose ABC transport system, periplasmic ribose-binding protein RbsB [Candidatus Carbobacillus altaicus]|uniref:Ribose ABC transport system, periplasmic ribose-binding protein RbsB n=1 Tax=Candidatus Carbonibacillus altaicus TaxID=2163959 RepID=A0A2R6Y0U1_9BACL|nr:MAG: Ribose ABC transport system, periplasmic ribose-binding protein RbsB [Candidatus Carbobacillus altaicus]